MLCVVMKILSHASAEEKRKMSEGFKFRTLVGRFHIMTVSGLVGQHKHTQLSGGTSLSFVPNNALRGRQE